MENQSIAYGLMKDKETWTEIREWWRKVIERRGDRALLRRCQAPHGVLLCASFYELKETLPRWPHGQMISLAAIAGLLSHVNAHDPGRSFPSQLGTPKTKDGNVPMSESRFRQLIKSRNWEEFYFRMRRAVMLLKRNANITSMSKFTLQFGLEQQGHVPQAPSKGFQFRMADEYYSPAKLNGKND